MMAARASVNVASKCRTLPDAAHTVAHERRHDVDNDQVHEQALPNDGDTALWRLGACSFKTIEDFWTLPRSYS